MEMYLFCRQRGLREVWGYLWSSWYSARRWKLWARSTSPLISRIRTTMNVENFWRQLKHDFLHNHVRPRLDHLVWIIIYNVTPNYMARAGFLEDGYRLGRSKALTTYQRYFKAAWKVLEKRELSGRRYTVNVAQWTCSCGQQKYHRHHLCKHLVHAVAPPPPSFFTQVVRRRTLPLYRHPALVPRGSPAGTYVDPEDGSISEGDDHVWLGNPDILRGGGGWRDLEPIEILGKRGRDENEAEHTDEGGPARAYTGSGEGQRVRYADESDDEDQVSSLKTAPYILLTWNGTF